VRGRPYGNVLKAQQLAALCILTIAAAQQDEKEGNDGEPRPNETV